MTCLTLDRHESETVEDKETLGEEEKSQISAELDDKLEVVVVYLSHLGRGKLHYFLFPLPRKGCSSQEASSFN